MEVRNHLLYSGSKQIRFVDSPNRKQGIRQLYLIMHYGRAKPRLLGSVVSEPPSFGFGPHCSRSEWRCRADGQV